MSAMRTPNSADGYLKAEFGNDTADDVLGDNPEDNIIANRLYVLRNEVGFYSAENYSPNRLADYW